MSSPSSFGAPTRHRGACWPERAAASGLRSSEGFYSLVLGYLYITLAAIVATVVVLAVLKLAEAAAVAPRAGIDLTRSTTLAAIVWAFAADRAGRAAVLVASARSRHRVAVVGPVVAVAGAAFLSWWAIVNVQLELDWPTAIAVLAIPIAFAVGALRARDGDAWKWRPRNSWRALRGHHGLAQRVRARRPRARSGRKRLARRRAQYSFRFHFERIGPISSPTPSRVAAGRPRPAGQSRNPWEVDPEAIAGWRDLRIELWRAEAVDGPIATDAIRPVAVNGVEPTDGTIDSTKDLPRYRDLHRAIWFPSLTGVTPDGRRLQLSGPTLVAGATFNGPSWTGSWPGRPPDRLSALSPGIPSRRSRAGAWRCPRYLVPRRITSAEGRLNARPDHAHTIDRPTRPSAIPACSP